MPPYLKMFAPLYRDPAKVLSSPATVSLPSLPGQRHQHSGSKTCEILVALWVLQMQRKLDTIIPWAFWATCFTHSKF